MPRIPIIRPPEEAVSRETGDGPHMLPPEEAAGLRTLEARTARIDRELAVSQSWLAGLTRLAAAEDAPEGPSPGFMRNFLEETDRERALILKPLPLHRQAPLEQDLMALRQGFAERAAALEAGAKDNGAPGVREHYHPNYYGAFVIGPDGHNIEAVCHTPVDVPEYGL